MVRRKPTELQRSWWWIHDNTETSEQGIISRLMRSWGIDWRKK